MKKIIILFLFGKLVFSDVVVGVIDTGLLPGLYQSSYGICSHNHIGKNKKVIHLHGSLVSSIIHKYSGKAKYCQIIANCYTRGGYMDMLCTVTALRTFLENEVDIVNISQQGALENSVERYFIKQLLDRGIIVVVAAGNDGSNMDRREGFPVYPAMYDDRIIVVGNDSKGSNYGSIVDFIVPYREERGVYPNMPIMFGTSFSAPVITGKLIRLLDKYNESN